MTPIAQVADGIRVAPPPVLIVDTCCFLDLFRADASRPVNLEELRAADQLLQLVLRPAPTIHLAVPELVPREFSDNATNPVEDGFRSWLVKLDEHRRLLEESAAVVGTTIPPAEPLGLLDLPRRFRELAERLLRAATVLARDGRCLEHAVARLIEKRPPSHRKEFKDSMNLEQAFELSRQLTVGGQFPHPICFVSSNTNDFDPPDKINPRKKLRSEFEAAALKYFPSLSAALGHIRGQEKLK